MSCHDDDDQSRNVHLEEYENTKEHYDKQQD